MDVCLVIKQRLEELGLEQRDLAAAAEVISEIELEEYRNSHAPKAAGGPYKPKAAWDL